MKHATFHVPYWVRMILLVGIVGSLNSVLSAQSLFERRSANQIDQYRDYAARNVGDLVTVLINESTDVENIDARSMDKTGQAAYNGTLDYGFGGDLGTRIGNGTIGGAKTSSRGFTGDTQYRSERQFTAQFTATVTDVLPNGNLVLAGHRRIAIQGDTRELMLSGIVRQYDILPNNTVPSHLVGSLHLELKPKGQEQAFTRQGWLARKVNKYWPF